MQEHYNSIEGTFIAFDWKDEHKNREIYNKERNYRLKQSLYNVHILD